MECSITPNTVGKLCRVCLTYSTSLISLKETVTLKQELVILDMLEAVTYSKIRENNRKFPFKICPMCLSLLKIAYEFQRQYANSQALIAKATKDCPVEKPQEQGYRPQVDASVATEDPEHLPVDVELIIGENKYDLNDIVVVEDEEVDPFSYEGFLNNLGTEISARFADESFDDSKTGDCTKEAQEDPDPVPKSPTKKRKRSQFVDLDLSRLTVKKYPEECKIEIEDDHHYTIKTLYECPTCKKVLPSANDLQLHKELKHVNFLVCEHCGHLAQTKSQLYHHMQKHKGKRFACNQCDKKYDTVSRLKFHQEKHKNERRFLCNVCGKSFNYRISLGYHMRLHAEKNYVCNMCGLKYRMPNTLKRHMRTHTKDKPYPCDYCIKRFPSKGEKDSHEMQHTGVRPYHCEFCGKGYIKSDNLKLHYLSHPGPEECDFCDKTFLEVRFLKMHLKRVHKQFDMEH